MKKYFYNLGFKKINELLFLAKISNLVFPVYLNHFASLASPFTPARSASLLNPLLPASNENTVGCNASYLPS
jgi:hypothetical protein